MDNHSFAPIWRRAFAWLIDTVLLSLTGYGIYWFWSLLVKSEIVPEKSLMFVLWLFFLATPFYFYRWKKLNGTPGTFLMRIVIVDHNMKTTISGDRAIFRSLLVVPFLPVFLSFFFFLQERLIVQISFFQSTTVIVTLCWFGILFFRALFDKNHQHAIDKLLRTFVVRREETEDQIHESRKEPKSFSYIILTLFSLFSVYPILRVFSISIRPGDRLLSKSLAIIPSNASFQTYYQLFFEQPFLRWLMNSFVVSAAVTLVGVGLASTAGYAFSRYKFRGRDASMLGLIMTQMFPATMLLLPLFIMLIKIGAYDSYFGLIIAYSATALPFTVWQMKGYYDTIPYSLEEAASIDGCSQFGIFWRIILPLATPALAITALFSFMTAWSEYLVAAVIIQDKNLFTLPLGLKLFQSSMQTSWGLYSAGAVVVSIPVVVIFLALSRFLVSGLTLGSVKG